MIGFIVTALSKSVPFWLIIIIMVAILSFGYLVSCMIDHQRKLDTLFINGKTYEFNDLVRESFFPPIGVFVNSGLLYDIEHTRYIETLRFRLNKYRLDNCWSWSNTVGTTQDNSNKKSEEKSDKNSVRQVFDECYYKYVGHATSCYLAMNRRHKKISIPFFTLFTLFQKLYQRYQVTKYKSLLIDHENLTDCFGNPVFISLIDIGSTNAGNKFIWDKEAKKLFISLLEKKKYDPNTTGKFNDTALAHACIVGNVEGAEILLANGAKISQQCAFGGSAYHWLTSSIGNSIKSNSPLGYIDNLIELRKKVFDVQTIDDKLSASQKDMFGYTPADYIQGLKKYELYSGLKNLD